MSIRAKSVTKQKNSPESYKKILNSTRNSLKPERLCNPNSSTVKNLIFKKLNSPKSLKKASAKNHYKAIRPITSSIPVCQLEDSFKLLLSSSGSQDKSSIFEKSFDFDIVGNQIFQPRPRKVNDSLEFSEELGLCQKKNSELKAKITKLQKHSSSSVSKLKILQETYLNHPDFKENTLKNQRSGTKKHKDDFCDLKKLIETKIHELKIKHNKQLKRLKSEFEENNKLGIEEMKMKYELKIKQRVAEVGGEFERKLGLRVEENNWLRKQNEKLKKKVEVLDAKLQTAHRINGRKVFEDKTNDQNRKYNEILKQYMQLQQDYLKIKNGDSGLCQKCKVMMNTNFEITEKISRIRDFIDSSNNE